MLLHTRDVCGGLMWAETLKSRPYPENLFKELNTNRVQTYNEYAYYAKTLNIVWLGFLVKYIYLVNFRPLYLEG